MKLVQCEHGHYYDADTYTICPHCNPDTPAKENAGKTVSIHSVPEGGDKTVDHVNPIGGADPEKPTEKRDGTTPPVDVLPPTSPMPTMDHPNPVREPLDTNPYGDSRLTRSFYGEFEDQHQMDPVTGWLVCTSGTYTGKSFQLKSGRNFIGRSADMDVSLAGEKTVSRGRHAVIIYEPKNRIFLAQPGDAHELFYVNDEVVLEPVVLKPYDEISLGKVNLRFVPFCTEKFAWEDLNEKKDGKDSGK